jgi:hypothetical protein
MAIVQNPITGRSKGKFASAVFSKQFGKNTMRSKPIEVRNPKTQLQREQRAKFSLMVELARKFLDFIRLGFKQAAVGMSQFNAFMQSNILDVITGVYPNYAIDYTKLVVTKGTLTGADDATANAVAGHKVTITWTDNTGTGDALATDKAMLLILNKDSKKVVQDVTTKTRLNATADLTVPASWVGHEVHAYISFINEAGNRTADSVYIGSVMILA